MKTPPDFYSGKSSSNPRRLRVGEEIRHALAGIFLRGECHDVALTGVSITVSEVRVSPDLKNATAYVMPLAGARKEEMMEALKNSAPRLRHLVSQYVKLRHVPRIYFTLDESFEEAQRIQELLKKPEVAKDLEKSDK